MLNDYYYCFYGRQPEIFLTFEMWLFDSIDEVYIATTNRKAVKTTSFICVENI